MYSVPVNMTSMAGLFSWANSVTLGWLGIGIVVMTFVIGFFALKQFETPKAFAFASFVTFILTVLDG